MSPAAHHSEAALAALEAHLGLAFHDRALLEQALTHKSYHPEGCDRRLPSNERLEFLGDALLDAVVATHLCRAHPDWEVGKLTRIKATLVSEATLSQVGRELGLGGLLLVADSEDAAGERDRPSILAGTLEAVVGAVFLDNRERTRPHHTDTPTCRFVSRISDRVLRAVERNPEAIASEIAHGSATDRAGEGRSANHGPGGRGRGGDAGERDLKALQARLGLRFHNRALLDEALIHSSYPRETRDPPLLPNERLRFIGKAMFASHIAVLVTLAHPDWGPEQLTAARSVIGSRRTRSIIAGDLNLGEFLLMGDDEEQRGGRRRPSMLADALEALVGAVFCDGTESDFPRFVTPTTVLTILGPSLEALERDPQCVDHKTVLQELSQEMAGIRPAYRVVRESGPEHEKTFVVEARLGNQIAGVGVGRTKKEAEQEAAQQALEGDAHSVLEGIAMDRPD